MSMKILVATGLYPPEIGGPATHIEILERELPAEGIEVVTIPFSLVRKYPKIIRHIMYVVLLVRALKDVDLLYVLDPVSVGLPALIASVLRRKKYVLRVAGDYAWEQAVGRYGSQLLLDQFVHNVHRQPFVVRILARVERLVARHAVCIVVPSEYMKGIVRAWGIAKEDIQVIYTAFSHIEVTEHREDIREMLGYTGVVVASVGRLVPWKGFRVLIDVIADLASSEPDVNLVIIGDGHERSALQTYALERGVPDRVRFVDRQPKETLAIALSGVDMFVLNTAYEGFSHQLLEVMDLGIPIITTSVGGNRELITHEQEGLLVEYNNRAELRDALLRLMRSASLRGTLVLHARERVRSFTIGRMVRDVTAVLTKSMQ